jgi:hypothetical protein
MRNSWRKKGCYLSWLQVKDSLTPAAGIRSQAFSINGTISPAALGRQYFNPLAAISPIVNPCAECYDLYNAEKNAGSS